MTFDLDDVSTVGLASQLRGEALEEEMAARAQSLCVPRLVDCTQRLSTAAAGDPSFGSDGTYVVTGGTGALGLLFVDWMAGCGARHFALLSRSGAPPKDSKAAFLKLEKVFKNMDSATLEAQKCDISSGSELLRVVGEMVEKRPVKGVVHAAGTLADGFIKDTSRDKLKTVCLAKA